MGCGLNWPCHSVQKMSELGPSLGPCPLVHKHDILKFNLFCCVGLGCAVRCSFSKKMWPGLVHGFVPVPGRVGPVAGPYHSHL